jgi:hypothetical protein
MKKIFNQNLGFVILGVMISLFIFLPTISYAQTNELMTNLINGTPVLPQADLVGIIFRIIQYVLMFVGVIAVVIIIYGGFIWMTAGGNDEKVNKAKKILVNGLIGLIVIILSYAIVQFVVGPLLNGGLGGNGQGGGGGGPPGLPKGANYLVITSKYPQSDETTARNTRVIISFNQNLVEESVKLARPVAVNPSQTSCVDGSGNPTWTVAIQNQNNEFMDGSLKVVGNSLIFTSTGVCPEPLNQFQCQGANGQACSQDLTEKGCCGCLAAGSNYKITLIASRGAAKPGLKGTRKTGNTMYRDENWNFNVGDYIDAAAPEVTKNLPQGNNVARNSGILVTFNKPIDLSTLTVYNPNCKQGTIECTKENCGSDTCLNYAVDNLTDAAVKIYQVDNSGNPILNGEIKGYFEKFSNKDFIFRPSAHCDAPAQDCRCFPSLANIKIVLDETKIKGANCLSLNCVNGKCGWQFKTSNSVDLDPPVVSRTLPINKAQDVDRLVKLEAEFNDASGIDPISINEDTFILWPTIVPAKIETNDDISVFTPSQILEAQTNYSPVVYGGGRQSQGCSLEPETVFGVKDLAGNTLVGNYRWDFKTGWLVNNGDPYIDRVSPEEGPKGDCVTVHGYNLGCCSPFECSEDLQAREKQWSAQNKSCSQMTNAGDAMFYAGELGGVSQYISAEVLSWRENKKPDKCSFGQCPSNCSLSTCPATCTECKFCSDPDPANCGTCWCPMPQNYSPENEIIIVVPDAAKNRLNQPGQVKVVPAY